MEDLVQQGNVGLMKSVKRFDPEKGVRLATYAVHWIKAEIHEFILRNWRIVKVATTKAQRKLFFNLRKEKKKLQFLNQDEASEIADSLNVPIEEVFRMEERLKNQDSFFDASFGDNIDDDAPNNTAKSTYLEDWSESPEYKVIEDQSTQRDIELLRSSLKVLDKRRRDILEKRWLREDKVGLKELAEEHGISMERVRQLEVEAIEKVRSHFVLEV